MLNEYRPAGQNFSETEYNQDMKNHFYPFTYQQKPIIISAIEMSPSLRYYNSHFKQNYVKIA